MSISGESAQSRAYSAYIEPPPHPAAAKLAAGSLSLRNLWRLPSVGRAFSEAMLIKLAYAYGQVSQHG